MDKLQNAEHDSKIVCALGFSRLYHMFEDGFVVESSLDLDKFGIDYQHAGQDVELATGGTDLHLAPGAGVILGKPGAGKTLFSNALRARNERVRVLRFREPESDSLLSEQEAVAVLRTFLEGSDADVLFVDSLRTTFYSTGGATGRGGVNMGIFSLLTAYDIIARQCGKVILFALNPMTTDDAAIEFYLEACRGSVTHTFDAPEPLTLRLSSRTNSPKAVLKNADRGFFKVRYKAASQTLSNEVKNAVPRAISTSQDDANLLVDLYTVTLPR